MYHRKTVDANILLEMKKRFYSKKYLYILLEDIRVKNLLPYTKSVEEALLQITLDLENNQSETQIPKFFDLSRYTFLKSMTSPLSVNSTRSAYDWGADALDEATLLLQHIRNKRRAVGETGGAIHIDIATTSPA